MSGFSVPKPVCSFAHFNFDEALMAVIRKLEYTQPTPIQSQVGYIVKKYMLTWQKKKKYSKTMYKKE